MSKDDKPIKVVAQISGFKKLKIEGGWRLQVDLFDSRLQDVLLVTALANESAVVDMEIGPHVEGKKRG